MPNLRINNSVPNSKSKNSQPNARAIQPTPHLSERNETPHPRVQAGGSVSILTTTFGGPGYMIGMMALTYTKSFTLQTFSVSDLKPHIRINNQ